MTIGDITLYHITNLNNLQLCSGGKLTRYSSTIVTQLLRCHLPEGLEYFLTTNK